MVVPATEMRVSSGQPCPDPSVTAPLTVTVGTGRSVKFSVIVCPAATRTALTRLVLYPRSVARTV